MLKLFITGTDTDVGKTYVACQIARSLLLNGVNVGAYKPVCSGASFCERSQKWVWSDIERLWSSTGERFDRSDICPQAFKAALAPTVAANMEGQQVSVDLLMTGLQAWDNRVDVLLIEGVGGWYAPLTEHKRVSDFAKDVKAPVLLVAPQKLGMINHSLLTLEAIQRTNLPVAGVVASEVDAKVCTSGSTNLSELRKQTDIAILGVFPNAGQTKLQPEESLSTMNWLKLIECASMNV